jgi:hypothetical protein
MSKKKPGKSVAALPPVERAVVAIGISEEREKELIALAASTKDITSITNDDGYKQVDSARKALKRERLDIETVCEETREDAQKFSKAVIARQKYLVGLTKPEEDRLQALQTERDNELERERQAAIDAELARQAALQERIAELRGNQLLTPTSGSVLLAEHISDLEAVPVDESFEEHRQHAETTKASGLSRLRELHAAALAHEAEQKRIADERAELAKLRAEAVQREAEQKERDRLAQVERDAEAARQRETLRLQQEELDRRAQEQEQAAQAERDRISAEQKRLDDERAELVRQQEELRIASLPPEPPPQPAAIVDIPSEPQGGWIVTPGWGNAAPEADSTTAATIPTADEIITALADAYAESDDTVLGWLRAIDWNAEVAEAA